MPARCNAGEGLTRGDCRPDAHHPVPSHALSETERARIIAVANEPRFADTPPARIVPALADDGIYIASESSFHRVLRAGTDEPQRPRPAATDVTAADNPYRDRSGRSLVLGCDVSAGADPGALVLSVSDP